MGHDEQAGSSRHHFSKETRRLRDHVNALAWLLDNAIRLPGGFRIGIDALIGLVPVLGDAAGMFLSAHIIYSAARLGAPSSLLMRMGLNVAMDSLVGLVPLLGDILDMTWKANQRNAQLLDRFLADPAGAARSSRGCLGLLLLLFAVCIGLTVLLAGLVSKWIWRTVTHGAVSPG